MLKRLTSQKEGDARHNKTGQIHKALLERYYLLWYLKNLSVTGIRQAYHNDKRGEVAEEKHVEEGRWDRAFLVRQDILSQ